MGLFIKLRKWLGQGDVDPIDDLSPVNRAVAETAMQERAARDQVVHNSRIEWEKMQEEEQSKKQEASVTSSRDSFLPVIRNFTEGDAFEHNMFYFRLGENIGAFAASVGIGDRGQTTIMYISKNTVASLEMTETQMADLCRSNIVRAGLNIDGMTDGLTGDMMITVRSAIGLATSLIFDAEFMDQLSREFDPNSMHVTIINSNTLLLTAPGSSFEQKFEEIAREDTDNGAIYIEAATYLWSDHQLVLVKKY